jgi:hypothetical protein
MSPFKLAAINRRGSDVSASTMAPGEIAVTAR